MSNCNICGEFTLSTTTCALCAMNKPPDVSAKELAKRGGDRHRPPNPVLYPQVWIEVMLRERVSDLFRTPGGLPGHWMQIQAEVNSVKNQPVFYNHGQTTDTAKEIFERLSEGIIASAKNANFDFAEQTLDFTSDMANLKLSRNNNVVKLTSQP